MPQEPPASEELRFEYDQLRKEILQNDSITSPFAPSDSNCLNFKLPIESSPQAQPLEDVFL